MKRQKTARRATRVLLGAAAAAVLLLVPAGCGGDDGGSTTTTAAPVDVPTTVFGRQARGLAVGIAAQRLGHHVTLDTRVIRQDGTPGGGLGVELSAEGGPWLPARACGPGRYCAVVEVEGPRPDIRVRLTKPKGPASTVAVRLPSNPEPERAKALVRSSSAALRRLNTLIINERLESGPPYPPLVTQFAYNAPDRLAYRITGGGESVVIGSNRWDRESATGPWVKTTQEPVRVPATDWRVVRDASMLGTARRDGRAVDLVSFYDPTVPAWYEGEVDRQTRLPLRMRMTAAAHFMTHAYGAFNAPLEILPPTR